MSKFGLRCAFMGRSDSYQTHLPIQNYSIHFSNICSIYKHYKFLNCGYYVSTAQKFMLFVYIYANLNERRPILLMADIGVVLDCIDT